MKIAIIGAGISGVAIARMLHDEGHGPVIFEKNAIAGGLIRCEQVEGNLYHKVGGHVFNSKNQKVLDWFWSFFDQDKEFLQAERNAKIWMQGKRIGYPIENHLYQLGEESASRVISELLEIHHKASSDLLSYQNFEEFLRHNFGETLYQLYFRPYNKKIWKTDLTQVAMEWLEGKLPMTDPETIILKNILRANEKEMVHSTFYYPKSNGSQFIIKRLSDELSINFNTPVQQLEYNKGQWFVNGYGPFDAIIYTGDARLLTKVVRGVPELDQYHAGLNALKSNGTSNLLCLTDPTDLSWLYIPEADYLAHRIIYTGNFSSSNNQTVSRPGCVIEFSGCVDEQTARLEVKKLPGNLEPLAYNYEQNSYVVQEKDTRALIGEVKKTMGNHNFYLLGRFAEWEYYNMDKAIEAGMQLFTILNNA